MFFFCLLYLRAQTTHASETGPLCQWKPRANKQVATTAAMRALTTRLDAAPACEYRVSALDEARRSLRTRDIMLAVMGSRFESWHLGGRWLARRVRSPRGYSADGSRRRRGRDVDISWRRVAAAPRLRRGYSAGGSRRRRGCDVDISWRRVAAAPRRRRGCSVETSRGGAAAATRLFRGDESQRHRGGDADIPR